MAEDLTQAQLEALQLFVAKRLHIEAHHNPAYVPPRCVTCGDRAEIAVAAIEEAGYRLLPPPEGFVVSDPTEPITGKPKRWWPANPEEKV